MYLNEVDVLGAAEAGERQVLGRSLPFLYMEKHILSTWALHVYILLKSTTQNFKAKIDP